MASNLPQFTLRIEKEQLEKLKYVAEYNARSCNREIELLIKRHIDNFEKANGKISKEDIEKLKS